MSWQMVHQVREEVQVPLSEKALLLLIASYSNPTNGLAWPTQETLAARLSCSVRWIRTLTARLKAHVPGFIVHTRRWKYKLRLFYEIKLPCPDVQRNSRSHRKGKERKKSFEICQPWTQEEARTYAQLYTAKHLSRASP